MQEDQKKEIQVSFGLKPSRQNKKSLRATQHVSSPKPRQTNSNPLDLNRNQTETKNPTTKQKQKQKQTQSQFSQETEEEEEEEEEEQVWIKDSNLGGGMKKPNKSPN
jgi:hypothetical protein